MLTSIAHATRPDPISEDAVDLLLSCHYRIRHFTALAARLAEATAAPPDQIEQTAASVARYFRIALPLHKADEDGSIYPRLCQAAPQDR